MPHISSYFTYQKNRLSGVAEYFMRMQSAPPNQARTVETILKGGC
jgi:hypothetical protein